jgi:essential nuclear protein 1
MYLTRPDEWSPAACYAATRLLASNLHAKDVVRFYSDVLLPRVLQDISENKKLNYHLYRALQKAVYKPDAFNKGILFPLCQAGGCTLREATVIGSVLSRVSIPMLHSAAALLYIAEQPYALSNSVFIHSLLDKKYSLPYRVIDALVAHFTRMKSEQRTLPLVWHISLLTFARRYKTEMESHQKDDLKLLMRVQTHPKVTPEIRRELFSARSRGEVMDPDANAIARAIASAS